MKPWLQIFKVKAEEAEPSDPIPGGFALQQEHVSSVDPFTICEAILEDQVEEVATNASLDKSITCHRCGKVFAAHLLFDQHFLNSSCQDKSNYNYCALCTKHFPSHQMLFRHEVEVHEKSRPFPCPHCDYRSRTEAYRKKHIETVHLKLKRFFCFCGAGFFERVMVRGHWKRRHPNLTAGPFVRDPEVANGFPVMNPIKVQENV